MKRPAELRVDTTEAIPVHIRCVGLQRPDRGLRTHASSIELITRAGPSAAVHGGPPSPGCQRSASTAVRRGLG